MGTTFAGYKTKGKKVPNEFVGEVKRAQRYALAVLARNGAECAIGGELCATVVRLQEELKVEMT